jgi:cytochrome P450
VTTELTTNLYREDVLADPYSYYGRLREEDPVHWNPEYKTWIVTRYEDVSWLLKHPELFSSEFYKREQRPLTPPIDEGDEELAEFVSEFRALEIIQSDPPEHTRLRAVWRKPFAPKFIAEWRELIRGAIAQLLDRVEIKGHMDVIEDVGRPLPLLVISEMLGVPGPDRQRLKEQAEERMASALSLAPNRMRRSATAIRESSEYFDRLLDQRTAESSDLLGVLVAAEHEGAYTREESVANAQGLLDAGHETTLQLIGNGTLAFMRHQEQWELFKSDPEGLAVSATEECLRYDPPLFALRRIAAADVQLRGRTIRKNDRVLWVIAAANRDPRVFDDPERFDIRRAPNKHLSFGAGVHYCLGQYLARVEGQEVFKALATRFPTLRLDVDAVEYAELRGVRSLKSLPVAWA